MNQSGLSAFPYLKPSLKSKPQLHTAVLMNHQEVDLAFKANMVDARDLVLGHWLLTGAVNQELFAKLQVDAGKTTFASLEILCTPAGAAYAIFCSQLGQFQHRHTLALYENKVIEFLSSASHAPFKVILESSGQTGERMLYHSPLPSEEFIRAQSMCQTIDFEKRSQFIEKLPSVIELLTTLNMMPSLNGESVLEVDVSILLPHQANADNLLDGRFAQGRSSYRH